MSADGRRTKNVDCDKLQDKFNCYKVWGMKQNDCTEQGEYYMYIVKQNPKRCLNADKSYE